MKRRTISLLCVVLVFLLLSVSVFAVEPVDMERKGSVSIAMRYQGENVPGGTLSAYRVAEITLTNGDYGFAFTSDFSPCGLSLEDISSAHLAEELASFAESHSIAATEREIDENGKVCFEDLELGLYLFVQKTPADGYCAVSPFLVSVPGRDGEEYVYDVDGSPKLSLEPAPTESTEAPPSTLPSATEPNLPQTGQTNWPVPVLAVSGVLLVMLGWYMNRSGKKEYHEE